jgi:hypothetical protein
MTLEKVRLPVFGEEEGVLFPRFGLKRAEGKSDAEIVAQVEAAAVEILAISQSASILPGRLLEAPCLD